MNKVVTIVLIGIAIAIIAYNVTIVDFSNPFQGDSTIALIGIAASFCAILLLLIYTTAKKIQKKVEED
ncbi:hypothetical protein SAMN04487911_101197 [Arenibacter nanhaiticus]|uniref:Uncharacterized protein n=1 Tax=Arenibacter nanhaiticus TaxID=558155 RepID=A0A1M6AER3_9FLAO|nr:hypothetical protein [Arenibacter nanhaiticus]SHI35036.1 hypothetical protein SAMN04487911_101197 [Arenibacter nanhaiticus]